MLLITVKDVVAGTWSNPVIAQNDRAAVRDFEMAVKNKESLLGQRPQDFQLFAIAEWHVPFDVSELPQLKVLSSFKLLADGSSYLEENHGKA